MTEILDEVVRLADRRRAAADIHDPDVDFFTVLHDPAAAELEAYLAALPESDARRLHALMYYGRGDDELLSLEAYFAANRDSIDWVRYAMFEKLPLADYLRSALVRAGKAKLDLAAWWRGELEPPPIADPLPRAPYTGPIFARSELLDGADPIEDGGRLFVEVAQRWSGDLIPLTDVDAFLSELKAKTGGLVTIDFIDLGCWDFFVGHEFEPRTNDLFLYWRDQRAEFDDLARIVFPADLYGLHIRLHEIRIVRNEELAVFLLQGVSTTPNEARKRLSDGASAIRVVQEDIFSSRIVRRVAGMTHVIDVHGAPLYTIAIIPKGHAISAGDTKRLLLLTNVCALETRLQRAVQAFADLEPGDTDAISEKGNTIRRIVERALKIEIILRDMDVQKPYGQLMIGDLIGVLYKHHDPEVRKILGKIAEISNRLSHDSGTPIDLKMAQGLGALAKMYVTVLRLDVAAYPHSVRPSSP